ncbi:MAG: class I tRNA ligase family protein [Paludibacteraceae bacterium]|nr:class I tRNA ligase family protein [Paludibacteraceae bacterium]
MYVWFDALTNYISSQRGAETDDFNNVWKNTIHFIRKDLLRFHADIGCYAVSVRFTIMKECRGAWLMKCSRQENIQLFSKRNKIIG